jgi:exodeoxyribonuclease X
MTKPEIAVIIDTETGSTNPEKAGICQLAAVTLTASAGNITTLLSTYCKPRLPMEQGAIAVHGITEEKYRFAPPERWAVGTLWVNLEVMAKYYTIYLAGHNFDRYDRPVLEHSGPTNDWSKYPTIDTLRWARRLYHGIDHKLEPLYDTLVGDDIQAIAHDAACDCHMTARILRHMLREEGVSMGTIAASLAKPRFYEFMPFGKYKGMALGTDVPSSYLRWMRENFTDPDPDLAETMRYYLSEAYQKERKDG